MARRPSGEAARRCVRAVLRHAHAFPHLLLVHALLRDRYVEDQDVGSLELRADGTIRVNPNYAFTTDTAVLAGTIFHVLLHVVLDHARRRGGRDETTWWRAADMVINAALHGDGLKLPSRAVFPPDDYQGPLQVEPLADYLGQHRGEARRAARGGPRPVTQGCGVPEGWAEAGLDDAARRALTEGISEAITLSRKIGAGSGTSAVAELLAPEPPRLDWRAILRHGADLAHATSRRDRQTFSRLDRRRDLDDGFLLPGWRSESLRLAVLVDVSGSMDRAWIARVVAEVRSMGRQFPGARIWLATHTDRVCWSGWLGQGALGEEASARAFAWTGGTDPEPAYQELKAAGRFDTVVHFTDGAFPVEDWPAVPPGVRLVVGAFGQVGEGSFARVPPGTQVIRCTHPRDEADDEARRGSGTGQ